jgi:S-adenosylmethionine decarboxylase
MEMTTMSKRELEALCSKFESSGSSTAVADENALSVTSTSRLPVPFFEGSEKRVEIHYVAADAHPSDLRGLRQVPRSAWAQALSKAGITIESAIYGEHWDCYMLSESSLFVSRTRIICKTCGQSAPLEIIEDALRLGVELGYEAKQVLFSRSDLLRPDEQLPVHHSFDAERSFLDQALPHAVSTNAYTVGDAGRAQWAMYSATLPTTVSDSHAEAVPPLLEIVCYGLDPASASHWWEDKNPTPYGARFDSGLSALVPDDGVVDELLFSPCGYSMNCFDQAQPRAHSTVHITPQEGCSFASFETTVFDLSTVNDTVQNVVEIFKPQRFSVSLVQWDMIDGDEPSVDPTVKASQYTMGPQHSQPLTSGSSIGLHSWSSFELNDLETVESKMPELGTFPAAGGLHTLKGKKCMPFPSITQVPLQQENSTVVRSHSPQHERGYTQPEEQLLRLMFE